MNNQRNMILAILLTGVLLFGWDAAIRHFYPNAHRKDPIAAAVAPKPVASATAKPTREGGLRRRASPPQRDRLWARPPPARPEERQHPR